MPNDPVGFGDQLSCRSSQLVGSWASWLSMGSDECSIAGSIVAERLLFLHVSKLVHETLD